MEPGRTKTPKVFGIGFHKTGTTSLGTALEVLGFRVCGPVGFLKADIAETLRETAFDVVDEYDAFEDNPWPLLYRELDERYPSSRFILTTREPNAWLASILRHFGGRSTPMRELIYGPGNGDPAGKEDIYLARYERHNAEVVEHFRGRGDLLVLDITAGDGWEKLCAFLGKPHPGVRFPMLNLASQRESMTEHPGEEPGEELERARARKTALAYGKPKK